MLERQYRRPILSLRDWKDDKGILVGTMNGHGSEEKLMTLISSFEYLIIRDSNLCDLAKTIDKGEENNVFGVLHQLIVNPPSFEIARNALFTVNYFAKKLPLDFFTDEIAKFYVQLMLNTSGEESRYVADIVATLYPISELVQTLCSIHASEFIFSHESIDDYSALLLEMVKHSSMSSEEATFVAIRVADLLFSSTDVKADALEILEILFDKIDKQFFVDKIDTIITEIYSEIPKIIGSCLRILARLGVPFPDLNMLFTYIESRDRSVAEPAAELLGVCANAYETSDHRIANRLLQYVLEAPYAIAVACLKAVFYFERTEEETDRLFELFMHFVEGQEGSDLLAKAKQIVMTHKTQRMVDILCENALVLDNLFFSDNEQVSELAEELIEVIQQNIIKKT